MNELDQGAFAQYRQEFKFVIQPIINPDGYEYTWSNDRMWRKNRRKFEGALCMGTDLNRNYDSNWGGAGSTPNKCSETYRGESAFSGLVKSILVFFLTKNLRARVTSSKRLSYSNG